jgi:hypothetical protein
MSGDGMGIKSQREFQNRTLKENMENIYTDEEIQSGKDEIDALSHTEMGRLYRFAPAGHKFFDITKPWHKYFSERFKKLGGMTPQISKEIGFYKVKAGG